MSYYLKFTKCDNIIQFILKLFYCLSTYLSLPCLPSYRVIEANWTSSWSLIQQKDHIHANPLFCVIYNLFWIVKLQNMTIYAEYRVQGAPTNKIRKHLLNSEKFWPDCQWEQDGGGLFNQKWSGSDKLSY